MGDHVRARQNATIAKEITRHMHTRASSAMPAFSQSYSTGPTTPATPTTPSLPPRIAPAGRREHQEPQFLSRDQDSQDPAEVAEAHAERVAIQQQNRAAEGTANRPFLHLPVLNGAMEAMMTSDGV